MIRTFLDEVASDSPAPGGGSVAGLEASLGAALGVMVTRLTQGRKKYEAFAAHAAEAEKKLDTLRVQMLDAMEGKIDAVAQHLESNADRVVVVEGNCDERGSNEYNMALGENRAGIIRNYLVQCGIDASRIQTRSFGEEKPAVVGSDESAWAKNRRGEFVIYQK